MRYFLLTILFSSSFAQLITPLDNAYLNHIYVLFEWEQIPETIGYDLQFSKDLEFVQTNTPASGCYLARKEYTAAIDEVPATPVITFIAESSGR